MEKKNLIFTVDPADYDGMVSIMDQYGDAEGIFTGHNDSGEGITVTVSQDDLMVTTCQKNGWVRKNIYYRDGTSEELFDGKWK